MSTSVLTTMEVVTTTVTTLQAVITVAVEAVH